MALNPPTMAEAMVDQTLAQHERSANLETLQGFDQTLDEGVAIQR